MPEAVVPPPWLRPLLRGRAAPASVRRALDPARPWPTTRAALAAAVLVDPASARRALATLREGAERAGDAALAARLLVLEARAIHRSGALDAALDAYARAEARLEAAGLPEEAATLSVARVDALATAGRVPAALALARRTAGRLPRGRSLLRASLALNRGNALRLAGDLEAAGRAYRGAERSFDALGSAYGAGVARLNAGVALVEAGEVEAARAAFERGAAELAARGLVDLAREARTNLAYADAQSGRLGAAVRALDALAGEHRSAGLPRREALCRLDLAGVVLRAGDAVSAEREALRAAVAFREVDARAERAEALWLAASAAAAHAPARAAAHVRAARRAAAASGRPAVVLRCDVLSTDLALRGGVLPAARDLRALERRARALGQRALAADVGLLHGATALARGRPAEARRRFLAVRLASRGRPWARVAADTGLATSEAATPAGRDAAIRRLREVGRFLDAVGDDLPGAWLRATFVAERLDPFLSRVELLLGRDAPGDRAEAEALLDALAVRRHAPAGARPRLTPRLAKARRRLEAVYDRLARGDAPSRGLDGGAATETTLERRARRWERAIADAWKRGERAAAPSSSAAAPRRGVDAGVAVVHLWRHDGRARGIVRVGTALGPGVDLGPARDWDALAESLRLRARRWAHLKDAATEANDPRGVERVLATVADRVLAPLGVESWPDDVRLVSDPRLPDLPWELLPAGGRRLGESKRLLRVPAARVAARSPARGDGVVVVGLGEPDLPGARREVASVAAAAGATRVLVGRDATREAVASALREADVVHVAGHGWEAEAAPPLGGIRVADGWFGSADLPPEGVRCGLVVLAACRTGRESGPAARAWGGLASALLFAGARRVVWTLDDVDDAVTGRFMSRFHEARAAEDDRTAFGRALADIAREEGHAAGVLPFRLSGVSS